MNKNPLPLILIICLLISVTGCASQGPNDISPVYPQLANIGTDDFKIAMPDKGEEIAVIKTSMGTIKVRFFPDYAPLAVENFITHSKNGYYNGVIFHRVAEDFVIQGGDPTGIGSGGESVWGGVFPNEVSVNIRHFTGALAMANAGADTNGSQFYIVQGMELPDYYINALSDPQYENIFPKEYFPEDIIDSYSKLGGRPELDSRYTVFGQVFEGMDVVDKIAAVEKKGERPVKDVLIKSIEVTTY